jgi:hypothetical protein
MGIVIAWLIGESILGYRWVKNGAPPPPGAVAAASVLFLGCGILGTYQPARTAAAVFAFGVDLAVLLNVLPGGNASQVTNWPPDYIPCGSLLPVNGGGVAAPPDCSGASTASGSNPANTPAAVKGANAANGAPASTPANPGIPPQPTPPTAGHGVIYPPGSQNL